MTNPIIIRSDKLHTVQSEVAFMSACPFFTEIAICPYCLGQRKKSGFCPNCGAAKPAYFVGANLETGEDYYLDDD